jgi:toxin-antitoxin system PIN domain toxin
LTALPDVNVLMALAWSSHPHHAAARDWFRREGSAAWATCLLTQSAFLRLSMNPKIVHVAIDCSTASGLLSNLVAHRGHQFIPTRADWTDASLKDLILRIVGYSQVTDATLLAIAKTENLQLITFDQAIASICPWQSHLRTLTP